MPCYEIRTISVDLKMVDRELLMKALENLGFNFYSLRTGEGFTVTSNKFEKGMVLNLKTGKATFAETDQKFLNQIKQEYSKAAIEKVAEKKKWILKKTGNRILAKKY